MRATTGDESSFTFPLGSTLLGFLEGISFSLEKTPSMLYIVKQLSAVVSLRSRLLARKICRCRRNFIVVLFCILRILKYSKQHFTMLKNQKFGLLFFLYFLDGILRLVDNQVLKFSLYEFMFEFLLVCWRRRWY